MDQLNSFHYSSNRDYEFIKIAVKQCFEPLCNFLKIGIRIESRSPDVIASHILKKRYFLRIQKYETFQPSRHLLEMLQKIVAVPHF